MNKCANLASFEATEKNGTKRRIVIFGVYEHLLLISEYNKGTEHYQLFKNVEE